MIVAARARAAVPRCRARHREEGMATEEPALTRVMEGSMMGIGTSATFTGSRTGASRMRRRGETGTGRRISFLWGQTASLTISRRPACVDGEVQVFPPG